MSAVDRVTAKAAVATTSAWRTFFMEEILRRRELHAL
jgi:hypothetical protein